MKKNSRTLLINIIFSVFIFGLCLIHSFFFTKLPELTKNTIQNYKILYGIKNFCFLLPAIFAAGFNISWCIEFGLHPEDSRLRFSDAMFSRFKNILITSLIAVCIITCSTEICTPILNSKIKTLEFKPALMKEYQRSAEFFYENKNYETAFQYARLANEIDPSNEKNKEILYITEAYYDKKAEISNSLKEKIFDLTFNDSTFNLNAPKQTPLEKPYESYELMKKAKAFLASSDYFAAHYYAQLALRSANNKDINVKELKQIASEAWNELNKSRLMGTTAEQKIFAKKYEGYTALINGDILRSYYIFHALSLESKKLAIDPDVVRYLEISENLLKKQYFFREETRNLKAYETANNVYFKIKNPDNNHETIYFIHGVTTSGSGSNLIQYLREVEIIELNSYGNIVSGYYIPYAKMSAIQTEVLNQDIKNELKLDPKTTSVPYIIVNSADKNLPDSIIKPEQILGNNKREFPSYLILNIPFSDFELIKQASLGAESMNLISLFYFINKADTYGFSKEVFNHILMNRMLNPLYLLILFIVIAWLSWHFRLEENSLFKFKWIIMFPLLSVGYIFLHKMAVCFFKFINYGIMGTTGVQFALCVGSFIYILMLIIASIFFLSCHNTSGK